jgi:hypothetical protein
MVVVTGTGVTEAVGTPGGVDEAVALERGEGVLWLTAWQAVMKIKMKRKNAFLMSP